MSQTAGKLYRATADVPFARIDEFLTPIIESIATHDMEVSEAAGVHHITSPFGRATLQAVPGGFQLTAEAHEPGGLNRLKHALTGPICFIAMSENPQIEWRGDDTEPTLPDDLRMLRVASVTDIGPRFRRILFRGDDLGRYDRDDQLHCRLIFQPRGVTEPHWPMLDHRGHVVWPGAKPLPTRVYTIRRIDAERGEITIDFALHSHAGPATKWALNARPGDLIGVLGPAANGPVPASFYVLAGDETALPGIARILEGMAPDSSGSVFIEVDGAADELPLQAPVGITIHWLHRNGAAAGSTTMLETAVKSVEWPEDLAHCFFWGGCEHKAFSAIHRHLRHGVGLPKGRFVLYSHWHRSLSEEEIIMRGAEAYLPQ